jgi:deoxyribodipyrimidine photo-lyase
MLYVNLLIFNTLKEINIVWLKRDVRLTRHYALQHAVQDKIPTLICYIFEPELLLHEDYSQRHFSFIFTSLQKLNKQLEKYNKSIEIYYGNVIEILYEITQKYHVRKLLSYQETGVKATFERDKQVSIFCKEQNIIQIEFPFNGIQRGKYNKKMWADSFMKEAFTKIPEVNFEQLNVVQLHLKQGFELPYNISIYPKTMQPPGEDFAWRYLNDFLEKRSFTYFRHISKPTESRISCSRISPYLAWGNISLGSVFQALKKKMDEGNNKRNLAQFRSRLFWNNHFIQKFEQDDRIEFENYNRAFDAVRNDINEHYLKSWKTGYTGYPLVDACMRCVIETGYLNFRMRAMLVSFLTHQLFQPWQAGVHHLAQQFLDFEPGIHYPQFQMQAFTQGTNTMRIYNSVKQSQDHDPEGIFIKKWVPELNQIPGNLIHEPWKLTPIEQNFYHFRVGIDYPEPIVDHEAEASKNKKILSDILKSEKAKQEIKKILKKHHRLNEAELNEDE